MLKKILSALLCSKFDKCFFAILLIVQALLVLIGAKFSIKYFPINFLIISFFYLAILLITNRIALSLIFTNILSLLIIFLNHLKIQYWGIPLMVCDYLYLKEPEAIKDVIMNYFYSFKYIATFIVFILTFAVLLVKAISLKRDKLVRSDKRWIHGLRISCCLLFIVFTIKYIVPNSKSILLGLERVGIRNKTIVGHTETVSYKGGIFAFLFGTMEMGFERVCPTKTIGSELIKSRIKTKLYKTIKEGEAPDIILILNESMVNPKLLEKFVKGFHMEKAEYVKDLKVNVFGGGTWISRFNALTGIDLSAFPSSMQVNPWLSFYKFKRSLPKILESEHGYNTYFFGIADIVSAANFKTYGFRHLPDNGKYSVGKNHDNHRIKKVLDILMDNNKHPKFVYLETLYPHGPYNEHYNGVHLATYDSSISKTLCNQFNDYLNRIHISRKELQLLFDYVNSSSRKTILINFGDHHPAFGNIKADQRFFREYGRYTTFYSVYSNFNIDKNLLPNNMNIIFMPGLILDLVHLNSEYYYQANSYIRSKSYGVNSLTNEELRSFHDLMIEECCE